jgi:hypothetical protein
VAVVSFLHAHNTIVRWAFIVGDVNFIAAGYSAACPACRHRRLASS